VLPFGVPESSSILRACVARRSRQPQAYGHVEVASARKRRVPLPSRVEIAYRFEGGDAVERTEADVEERRRRQRGMGIR
jgi:hypothetical protein